MKASSRTQNFAALVWGAVIGILGGLIGLGGAEFRLPVLVSVFKFRTLNAIVVNLIVSLVTVIFSFIFRSGFAGFDRIAENWSVVVNLLAGSLIGSFAGVHLATKINEHLLHKVVVVLLVCLSFVLIGHEFIFAQSVFQFVPAVQIIIGFIAGLVIGLVSSMLGVAGGELIIPTIILLYGVDVKLAGSLSLAISIPTIIMGLIRYRQNQRISEAVTDKLFIVLMSIGSIIGALLGSYLLRFAPSALLQIGLGIILLASAIKLARKPSAKASAEP